MIVKNNQLAYDSLGGTIMGVSDNGIVTPHSFTECLTYFPFTPPFDPDPVNAPYLHAGDTTSVVPFSYDIQAFKLFIDGMFSSHFFGNCNDIIDSGTDGGCAGSSGLAYDFICAGLSDSSDVNNSWDLIYKYAKQKKQNTFFSEWVNNIKTDIYINIFNN